MNKYIQAFIKQNPIYEAECLNCKHKNKFKSIDVFKSKKDYSFICSKCNEKNTIQNIPEAIKSLEKQLKAAGISVK